MSQPPNSVCDVQIYNPDGVIGWAGRADFT